MGQSVIDVMVGLRLIETMCADIEHSDRTNYTVRCEEIYDVDDRSGWRSSGRKRLRRALYVRT